MYLTTLRTMTHQGSVTLILASAAFSGSSTMALICSVVSLIFIVKYAFVFRCKDTQRKAKAWESGNDLLLKMLIYNEIVCI